MTPPLVPAPTLTRHAVCVGMTGSGKTGLCVGLLEDLALAGVPVLALDPKGDLTNLALVLPDLDGAAFRPWIDPAEAARQGRTPDAHAAHVAATWKEGLAKRGLGPADLRAWRERVDVQILTPGAESGTPVDVIGALTTCPAGLDPDGLRAFVSGAVTALLGLVDDRLDPVKDPEGVLLARLLTDAFADGRSLPLAALLPAILDPPFDRLGYFPLDQVIPPEARTKLALKLNNVVASPTFAAWQHGETLDLDAWTRPTADGRTPIRVLVLSHLTDAERMFFVSTFLTAVVAWTRRLPGTSDLRALVYFDEVFGFLPPHPKDPPSKQPVLTLMKQARAVGVGVVLATQNPVDVDYKALSNAATWLVGRLQTDNDRDRVLEGLLTTDGQLDRSQLDATIAGLAPRRFLVRDAHGKVAEVASVHTRSFLRGPLSRGELARLRGEVEAEATDAPRRARKKASPPLPHEGDRPTVTLGLPPVPEGVSSRWLTHRAAVPADSLAKLPQPVDRWVPLVRVVARASDADRAIERTHWWASGVGVASPLHDVDLPHEALSDVPPDPHAVHALLPGWLDEPREIERLTDHVVDKLAAEVGVKRGQVEVLLTLVWVGPTG